MSKQYRKSKATPVALLCVLAVLSLALLVCGALIFRALMNPQDPTFPALQNEPQSTTAPSVPEDTTTPSSSQNIPVTSPPDAQWTRIEIDNSQMHTGDLILVNYQYPYVFPQKDTTLPFYGNKTAPYKLRSSEVSVQKQALLAFNALIAEYYEKTDDGNVIVISGYRDLESQQKTYQDYVDKNGLAAAEKYVAKPSHSEHHTGLALDLAIYTDDGKMLALGDAVTYQDFLDAAFHQGYILRYNAEKYDITRIYDEEWHFRYVGVPHAHYMSVKGLCLEEYINALRAFPYDGDHLTFSDRDLQNWEIYYVSAAAGQVTTLPVPADAPYTVSGNNADGFIVTVQR